MYDRILVPLDGSRLAEVALDHASELARRFNSRLILLQVVAPIETLPGPGGTLIDSESEGPATLIDVDHSNAEVRAADEYLGTMRANLTADGLNVTSRVLEGEPVEGILREANAAEVSLIVMSTHGHGGLKHSPVGSVAASVLHDTSVPLHIIPYR